MHFLIITSKTFNVIFQRNFFGNNYSPRQERERDLSFPIDPLTREKVRRPKKSFSGTFILSNNILSKYNSSKFILITTNSLIFKKIWSQIKQKPTFLNKHWITRQTKTSFRNIVYGLTIHNSSKNYLFTIYSRRDFTSVVKKSFIFFHNLTLSYLCFWQDRWKLEEFMHGGILSLSLLFV